MINDADLNILVSNVVSENNFKHCRLCLQDIQGNFLQFHDCISDSTDNKDFKTLSTILGELFGYEICNEIAGVNAVCCECAHKLIECSNFMDQCKRSTELLSKIFKNLSEALNIDVQITDPNQRMYVVVGQKESKVVLVDKNEEFNFEASALRTIEFSESDNVANESSLETDCLSDDSAAVELPFCKKCQILFDSTEELTIHMSEPIHKIGIKCPDCQVYKHTEKSLKSHIDKCHTPYVCKDCGKTCIGLEKLYTHEEQHNKNECPRCGKLYITKDSYTKHVELCIHDKLERHPYRAKSVKAFFCESCGKGYSTSGGLRVHNRFVHGNAKHHVCEHCGKEFTAPSYLKTHMIKHTGEKNFNCTICTKKFVSKEALLYHTRRHTGEKPYSCKLCTERFVNASARAEHIKYKHSKPKYHCTVCNRNFFTISFLRQHMQRHTDPSSKLYFINEKANEYENEFYIEENGRAQTKNEYDNELIKEENEF